MIHKYLKVVVVAIVAFIYVGLAHGAVSLEDAKKLGSTLTLFGAEKAGNKEGTIPEYTGGLTKLPPEYKPGSGIRPDPFSNEKPLFSIDAKNMDQYAEKLTEGTKAMMKKHSTFRIDVYKTYRTVAYPKFVLENTVQNAVNAKTINGGLSLTGAHQGIPFPIPNDGNEVIWNHLTRYEGSTLESLGASAWNVDSNGKPILSGKANFWMDYPYYRLKNTDIYFQLRCDYNGPPRLAGQIITTKDPLNMAEQARRAWQYLPGQRRVKQAPELAFDTPNPNTAGVLTFDDTFLFFGSMERYNWKLIEKKEMYVPYNAYRMVYGKSSELFNPKHLNPDLVRWELHRVWVVEASLKKGKRHLYHNRRFYVDEDSWGIMATENYDARGQLYKVGFNAQSPYYEMPAASTGSQTFYDMMANNYTVNTWLGDGGSMRAIDTLPERFWSPDAMAGGGIR